MSAYLLIDLLVVSVPLLLSFDKKVRFYKKIPTLLITIFAGGIIFIPWDIIATGRGDWSFNPEYVSGIYLLGLPLEEILFFIVVPYSILFIHECIIHYTHEKHFTFNKYILSFFVILFASVAYVYRANDYTMTVFAVCALILLFLLLVSREIIVTKSHILTICISFVPFLIVNYILTSLPIVSYGTEAIIGLRILTIPVEDFFYMFAMVATWLTVYTFLEGKRRFADDKSIAQQAL